MSTHSIDPLRVSVNEDKKVLLINGPGKSICIQVHEFSGHLQGWRGAVGGAEQFIWLLEQWWTLSSISVSSLGHLT